MMATVATGLPTRAPRWVNHRLPWRSIGLPAVAATGGLLGVASVALRARTGQFSDADLALGGLSGFLFIAAGVIAHRRGAAPLVGWLMVLVGAGWFAEDLQFAAHPVPFTAGQMLVVASTGFLVHLVLAFPTGRLESRPQRWLVAAGYLAVFAVAPLRVLGYQPDHLARAAPQNLLLVPRWSPLTGLADAAVDLIGAVVAIGVLGVLVRRWSVASPHRRRVLAPVLLAGLVGAGASLGYGLLGDVPAGRALLVVYKLAFCALPLGFLVGVLRDQLGRNAASHLLARLPAAPTPHQLRDRLAEVLGDRTLQVGYWRPDGRSLVDAHGQPLDPSGGGPGRASTIVEHGGRPVAALIHDPTLCHNPHVLHAVAATVGLTLANQRLAAEVRAQREEAVVAQQRAATAADQERRRLERDLHDGAQQHLVAAALGLRLIQQGFPEPADPQLRELVAGAAHHVEVALVRLRWLAGGTPSELVADGLVPALRTLVARSPLPVELAAGEPPPLPREVQTTAYFVVAEALANAMRHGQASRCRIQVGYAGQRLRVEVSDDGVGGADPLAGSGLAGLADRVRATGGELTVHSPPGQGTSVTATLPDRPAT